MMEKPENRLISPFFTRYSGEKPNTPDTIHMTTASPDSKNAPDTAPEDMKPTFPNLLHRGVQSAQPRTHQRPAPKPNPVPGASIPTVADTAIELGITDQFPQEFPETLAQFEFRAMIPATEQELGTWARREYPADMWLYDLLREQHGYQGGWQHLLREGGEFLCFDYPASFEQPNCQPSILALQNVAKAAGFALTLTPSGDTVLPECAWIGGHPTARTARIEKAGAGTSATANPSTPVPCPPDYCLRVASDKPTLASTVAYLVVAGHAAMSPKWGSFLLDARMASDAHAEECSREARLAERLHTLPAERKAAIKRFGDQSRKQPLPPQPGAHCSAEAPKTTFMFPEHTRHGEANQTKTRSPALRLSGLVKVPAEERTTLVAEEPPSR